MSTKPATLLGTEPSESCQAVLDRLRRALPRLKQKYGAFTIWLVNPESLVTKQVRPVLLVELEKPLTLIQFIGLEQAIGRALGKKVLLVQRQQYLKQHGERAGQNLLLISE